MDNARFEYHFVDGLLEGVAREWFAMAPRCDVFHYDAGQEGGNRCGTPTARRCASYFVRAGRRYGVLGAKGCVTEEEDK